MRPSWYVHFVVLGCLAFVVIITGFFVSGGSARSDADEQNLWALGLLLGFGGGGLWLWWAAYLRRIRWKGNEIVVSDPFRANSHYRFADVVDLTENADGSEAKLHMADGRMLRVSTYFHGYNELMDDIERYFVRLMPPAARF